MSDELPYSMTFEEFRDSFRHAGPAKELSLGLTALWWDAKGDWTKAHESAPQDEGPACAWVHAYLHRKEGDLGNARYWYVRAGRKTPEGTLEQEWTDIARALLSP